MSNLVVAALSLGGNIGDTPSKLREALVALHGLDNIKVIDVSRLFKTPPWGKIDQDWFVNACALVETSMEPVAFWDVCLELETQLGRVRQERWGPRVIDIDVLLYGDFLSETNQLTVPHPRMTERAFVMVPLADIASDLVVNDMLVGKWKDCIDPNGIEVMSDDGNWWRD